MGVVDLELQDHFARFDLEFWEIWVVSAITRQTLVLKHQAISIQRTVTHFCWIHQICTKHASWDTLDWHWKWGHWPWPSSSFSPFWLKILGTLLARAITCNRFELESPNLHTALGRPSGVTYPNVLLWRGVTRRARYSKWSLVLSFTCPKIVHWSEWSIVRYVGSPRGHWSKIVPLVRIVNCQKWSMISPKIGPMALRVIGPKDNWSLVREVIGPKISSS